MKQNKSLVAVLATAVLIMPQAALANLPVIAGNRLLDGVLGTVLYSVLGLLMAVLGVKLIDWVTPGNLARQIGEEKNVAAAILAGSLVLGLCIIIAAAIAG